MTLTTITAHPSPAPCSTGSWSQRWNCGWNEPTTTATHAGYVTGHNILPLLVIAAVIIAIAVASRRRRSEGTSGTKARPRARNWGTR